MTRLAHFKDVLKEDGSSAPGVQTNAIATTPGGKKKKKTEPSHDGGSGGSGGTSAK